MTHIEWIVSVNFEIRILECSAFIEFDKAGETTLDTRDIQITELSSPVNGSLIEYTTFSHHPVVGDGIRLIVPHSKIVQIVYKTSPNASGLQWLDAQQTADKRHPFMFSQGQCLHTRSFLPCQDTPGVRFTFDATISLPNALRALMGALHMYRHECAQSDGRQASENWVMTKPIPAYLVSLAVGELEGRDITDRCRVYAEPMLVVKAAAEFRDLGKIMETAERLAGTYEWERFDMLVLPPSFPYGGMENPRLAFLSPTIVSGTGSMVNVVAHELAHAWTGNLITNASWGDFWLNEGWTTYFEHRILEEMYGKEELLLHMAVEERDLKRDLDRFFRDGKQDWTKLCVDLTENDDPDDVFSRIPYLKGAQFLHLLEQEVGREHFDVFIRRYIKRFRFTSICTQEFLDFVDAELPNALEQVRYGNWINEAGMPDNAQRVQSQKASVALADAELNLIPLDSHAWSSNQWILYLQSLSRDPQSVNAQELLQFNLHNASHIEVRWSYLLFCLEAGYMDDEIRNAVTDLLMTVGRMKYILPIYRALAKHDGWRNVAQTIFSKARSGYHPIAVAQVERILKSATEKPAT